MDSLLIVLVVIGVVMILAGVARMRSKRRHSWGEIDHSVLFARGEQGQGQDFDNAAEDSEVVGSARVVVDDSEPALGAQRLVIDDNDAGAETGFALKLDKDEEQEQEQAPATRPAAAPGSNRARAILSKLRGEDKAPAPASEAAAAPKKGHRDEAPDKVIVLNVMAPPGQHFLGPALLQAIEAAGLRYRDEMQIYHYYRDEAPLFGLVNMVKPGVFQLDDIDQLTTPGVSLFIQMPNDAASGLAAFDTMLGVAQELAQGLGGELRDETRSVLTHSAIDHIRQQIAEYDCKWLASA